MMARFRAEDMKRPALYWGGLIFCAGLNFRTDWILRGRGSPPAQVFARESSSMGARDTIPEESISHQSLSAFSLQSRI